MNSKVLVASLLALATGVAAAQESTITIRGRLNLSVERLKDNGVSTTEMVNSASRFVLKGSEDLGGGMSAGMVLESGFDPSNGTSDSPFWARQSEVNLGGPYGQIRLGNFTSEAYYATADYVSLHNHDTGTSADALYADTRGFGQANKLGYMSPDFGGTVFHAAVNTRQDGEADRTYDLAVNHDAGPLHVGAGYQKTGDANQFAVRTLYELGDFTVGGYVQRDKDVYASGSRTTLRLSGMYTIGATELHLNFGRAGDYGDVNDSAASQVTLALNYNLSKRTKLYTFYTKLNDGAAALYGGDRSSFALGMRHNF